MSTYRTVNVNNIRPQLTDSAVWADIRFDPEDVTPTYIGLHTTRGVSTSDTDWKLFKFTYSATTFTTRIQLAYGMWDTRSSYF